MPVYRKFFSAVGTILFHMLQDSLFLVSGSALDDDSSVDDDGYVTVEVKETKDPDIDVLDLDDPTTKISFDQTGHLLLNATRQEIQDNPNLRDNPAINRRAPKKPSFNYAYRAFMELHTEPNEIGDAIPALRMTFAVDHNSPDLWRVSYYNFLQVDYHLGGRYEGSNGKIAPKYLEKRVEEGPLGVLQQAGPPQSKSSATASEPVIGKSEFLSHIVTGESDPTDEIIPSEDSKEEAKSKPTRRVNFKYVYRNGERVCLSVDEAENAKFGGPTVGAIGEEPTEGSTGGTSSRPEKPIKTDSWGDLDFFPDLKNYFYTGTRVIRNLLSHEWTGKVPAKEANGDKDGYFKFYVDVSTGAPVQWLAHRARNPIFNAHTDVWKLDYLLFEPAFDAQTGIAIEEKLKVFELPIECIKHPIIFPSMSFGYHKGAGEDPGEVLPATQIEANRFHRFHVSSKFGRKIDARKRLVQILARILDPGLEDGFNAKTIHNHYAELLYIMKNWESLKKAGKNLGGVEPLDPHLPKIVDAFPSLQVFLSRDLASIAPIKEERDRIAGIIFDAKHTFNNAGIFLFNQHIEQGKLGVYVPTHNVSLPQGYDARATLKSIRDQAICGSCWSFSFIATVEGQLAAAGIDYHPLSEQFILDCAWGPGSHACDGGDTGANEMLGIGIPESKSYGGYLSTSGRCHTGMQRKAIVDIWVMVPPVVDVMKQALYREGILSVALYCPPEILYYGGGIVDTPKCANITILDTDHAVVLVGFDDRQRGGVIPHWILRNSWSTAWGELGHFRVSQENDCGISTDVGFPRVSLLRQDIDYYPAVMGTTDNVGPGDRLYS